MAAALSRLRTLRFLVQLQAVRCHRISQHMCLGSVSPHHYVTVTQKCHRCATCSNLNVNFKHRHCTAKAAFHTCSQLAATEVSDDEKSAEDQKRKLASRITLLDSEGNSMGQMKKSEAIYLAKSNNQILVEVEPMTFKLVDQKEPSSKRSKSGSKAKQLIIKSKISEHDLEVKMKHVINWLEKSHEVFIIINNTDPSQPQRMSQLLESITNTCKDLAVVKQVERTEQMMRLLLKPKTDSGSKGNKPPDILKFADMKKANPKQ